MPCAVVQCGFFFFDQKLFLYIRAGVPGREGAGVVLHLGRRRGAGAHVGGARGARREAAPAVRRQGDRLHRQVTPHSQSLQCAVKETGCMAASSDTVTPHSHSLQYAVKETGCIVRYSDTPFT